MIVERGAAPRAFASGVPVNKGGRRRRTLKRRKGSKNRRPTKRGRRSHRR